MATTRFPNGLTTTAKSTNLGEFILPDPTTAHVYWEDFDYFNPATTEEWNITNVSTGTIVLDDADGGVLLITNAGADTNLIALNKVGESFLFEKGKKTWFKSRIKLSSNLAIWVMGLQVRDASPASVADGVYLSSGDNVNNISLTTVKDSGTPSSVLLTTEDFSGEFIDVGFYFDGINLITGFINNVALASINADDLPETQVLTISMFVENESTNARSMSVDYILAAKER